MKFSQQNILITGGASGIGLAFAERFLAQGNRVMICGRNREKLAQAKRRYPKLIVLACDISKAEDVDELVAEIDRRFVSLNVLVNNAAIQQTLDFNNQQIHPDKIRQEIEINLIAPMQLCLRLLPRMHGNGSIINITSALAIAPKQSTPVYNAAKAGLRNFSHSLRYQVKQRGIQVIDIVPALVETQMSSHQQHAAKISPHYLVEQSLKSIARGKNTIYIEKARWLYYLYRLCPPLALRILQHG